MKRLFNVLIILLCFGKVSSQDYDTCVIREMTKNKIDGFDIYYECNGEKCNGNKVSFWSNDLIYIKGKFNNGKPYDTLYIFNENGATIRYIDTINHVDWYLDDKGIILYSSSGLDSTLYDKRGKKTKSVHWTGPPSLYVEWTIEYDENENQRVRYSEENFSQYLSNKKFAKHIHIVDSSMYNIYELTIFDEDKTYLLRKSYYKEVPKNKTDIIDASIITVLKREHNDICMLDMRKNKYFKIMEDEN